MLITLALLSIAAVSAEDNVNLLADENVLGEVHAVDSDEQITQESGMEIVRDDLNGGDELPSDYVDVQGDDDIGDLNYDASEVPQEKIDSTITASDVEGYESFTTAIIIKLTANSTTLSSKMLKIILNGVTYNKLTDENGEVKLNVKLNKGIYAAEITYLGDDLTYNATKTCKVTIVSPIKTKLKLGDAYINYRQGSKCLFYVKLLDENNKTLKNQKVLFKVAGKNYTAITDNYGNAKIYLNLKNGTYTIKYYFIRNSPYLTSSGYCKIKVKPRIARGNGYWLWSSDMKRVNLKSLSNKGTKHIFLHVQAISRYGKSAVISFIKKAHKNGMKVHLWMQVCYRNGKWIRPIDENNQIKYEFLDKRIKEAKKYAKIKGVDGIHFDYVRFGGTAHLYENPNRAINYFIKKASIQIRNAKPNCIVSAAIMPQPSKMTSSYGQDVSTMSKYADVLVPMEYKGNFNQSSSWITSVTKTFVNQSNGAQMWVGLQSYHSDSNPKKLTQTDLLKDSRAAMIGGAKGVLLFRIGLSCNFNFKNL